MDVHEIQSRVAEAYASFQSLRDHGTQTTTFIKGPKAYQRHTDITEFSVEFVRPFSLVTEEAERAVGPREEWRRSVVWTRGQEVHQWSTLWPDGPTLTKSLGFALSAMHLASSLLKLLVPERAAGGTFADLPAELVGTTEIDGRPCWDLGVRYSRGPEGLLTVWIDKETMLVRRIEKIREINPESQSRMLRYLEQRSPESQEAVEAAEILRERLNRQSASDTPYTTVATTDYHPEINPHIDPTTLTFTPP